MSRPWVVLKFGGTSVATAANWAHIARRIEELLPDHRVWLVASALSQVSNRLEEASRQALAGEPMTALTGIEASHRQLADDLELDAESYRPIAELLAELRQLLEGTRLTQEASPKLRARMMSFGELASTHLGLAALRHFGLAGVRVDSRDLLTTIARPQDPDAARYLSAEVAPRSAPQEAEDAAGEADLVVCQGFIARNAEGETCLLGRGGSDTSAALFAALIDAESMEIWTDVHGLFTTDPRQLPTARLIRKISYREAQELAAMGAKVLHPRCLGPSAWAGIPVAIRNTRDPNTEGTVITAAQSSDPAVMAVVRRSGVTLLSISTLDMWGASGFLARVFAPFERLGISVDLVATSQSTVTVTLDHIPDGTDGQPFAQLIENLEGLGTVTVVHPCAVVSVVGRRIRTVLHELGSAFSVFRQRKVHLVSESSDDLNLSFVVDEGDAPKLVADLHSRLLPLQGGGDLFGPSWEQLQGTTSAADGSDRPDRWWKAEREKLLQLVAAEGGAVYAYHLPTVRAQADSLLGSVRSVSRFYYAIKANPHPAILQVLAERGVGMECVSAREIEWVREHLGDAVPILFTPNFCPLDEYERAYALGAEVTIDGPQVLQQAPSLFAGQPLALRIDPGGGLGHDSKVVTAGAHAKFGHPLAELDGLVQAATQAGAVVVGLHSHVGSGILQPGSWSRTAGLLAELAGRIDSLQWLDIGGGLGVPERPGQKALDLDQVEAGLARLKDDLGALDLRMEPGRFFVSEAGVLAAPVTQVRSKGDVRFIGLSTGMNSLIRPALYGAWHGIHNLSRLGEPPDGYWHVVGPICETGDVLGRDRLLPHTESGDVVLIENAGAYGRVMSCSYNKRDPAVEIVLTR